MFLFFFLSFYEHLENFYRSVCTFLAMVNLDRMCIRLGMDVKELAKAMGLAPSTVYKWKMRKEDGGAYPSYEISRKLLELGASVEDLFGFDCSQKCQKQAEYRQPSQAVEQVKEPSASYNTETVGPLANSPTMKALIKRLEALEQRNYRAEKAG